MVQYSAILLIVPHTIGAFRRKGTPAPEWAQLSLTEFAAHCDASETAVIDALQDAVDRGLIARRRGVGKGGSYEYKLLSENWESAPAYTPGPRLAPKQQQAALPFPSPDPEPLAAAEPAPIPSAEPAPAPAPPRSIPPRHAALIPILGGAGGAARVLNRLDAAVTVSAAWRAEGFEIEIRGEGVCSPPPLEAMREFLTPYFRRLFGTVPDPDILARSVAALGSASIEHLRNLVEARLSRRRPGRIEPGLFPLLCADAAAAAAHMADEPAESSPASPRARAEFLDNLRYALQLLDHPGNATAFELDAAQALVSECGADEIAAARLLIRS